MLNSANGSIGIASIQWRFYIIFAVLNLAWVPIIWYFYVETAGLSLEEIDRMFETKYHGGKGMSWKEAAQAACEDIRAARLRISDKAANIESSGIEHQEHLFEKKN